MELADIDLLDRDRFTQDIPHEWFTHLRANAPVYKHPEPDGPGFWVITKHADVIACNRDAGAFSSEQERGGVVGLEEGALGGGTEEEAAARESGGRLMLMMDPPDHTRYRKLVNRGFTPRMIGQLEPHILDLTDEVLDKAVVKDGEIDFVVDIAAELPLEVIAELIGVPSDERHKIFEWSNRMIGSEDPEYTVSAEEVFNAQVEMFLYAQQLAEKRRAEPADDIITALLSAEVDGESLSDMDFNLFFLLLSVAGNETTRNAIAHGMNALLENPEQYELLVSDPEAQIAGAVEEILRWSTPVMYFRRNATRDVEVGGRDDQGRRQDQPLVHLGQPRRGRLRRPLPLRHHPPAEPAHRLRWWWAPLLLGRPAGPPRDPDALRGDGQALPPHRGPRSARPVAQQLHRRHQAPSGSAARELSASAAERRREPTEGTSLDRARRPILHQVLGLGADTGGGSRQPADRHVGDNSGRGRGVIATSRWPSLRGHEHAVHDQVSADPNAPGDSRASAATRRRAPIG